MPGETEEVLAGEWQIPEETTQENLPAVVEEPETAATEPEPREVERTESEPESREDLERLAAEEGETEVILSELEDKPEITLEDLRRLNREGLSDDELVEVAKANGLEVKGYEVRETRSKVTPAPVQRNFKVFAPSGKEATDLGNVSADSFVNLARIQYKANGELQLKTFPELVRLAQLGHHNEARLAQVVADRAMALQQNEVLRAEVAKANSERTQFAQILGDQTGELFLKAQELYLRNLHQPAPAPTTETPAVVQARGIQYYQSNIMPALIKIQADYPTTKLEEIDKVAQWLISQEPLATMPKDQAWERLKWIVNTRIPQMIEEAGHIRKGTDVNIVPSVATRPGDVPPMRAIPGTQDSPDKLENLRLKAELGNARREATKGKLRRAPTMDRVGPEGQGGRKSATDNLSAQLSEKGMTAQRAKEILWDLKE